VVMATSEDPFPAMDDVLDLEAVLSGTPPDPA
jgi:hypothetical protein